MWVGAHTHHLLHPRPKVGARACQEEEEEVVVADHRMVVAEVVTTDALRAAEGQFRDHLVEVEEAETDPQADHPEVDHLAGEDQDLVIRTRPDTKVLPVLRTGTRASLPPCAFPIPNHSLATANAGSEIGSWKWRSTARHWTWTSPSGSAYSVPTWWAPQHSGGTPRTFGSEREGGNRQHPG